LNARVIAATNRDPIEMIAKGRLREDLYYRIATVTIRIPPLRERCEDVIPLAEHFCSSFRVEFRRPKLHFGDATRQALLDYDWPGNVRELRNVVERASMLSKTDEIGVEALDLPIGTVLAKSSQGPVEEAEATSLADVERQHIARILSQVGGSRTRAAKLLGISRSTLWEKAKRLGLV
jgi:transcriptional regulator with PAS, ATPase and Fis domain